MSAIEDVEAAEALPPPSPPPPVRLRFVIRAGDYRRLMLRGAILQLMTLGIYRHWLFTDQRRILWAAIKVAGETPEYTGRASELLIGFLVAVVGILIPINILLLLGVLEFSVSDKIVLAAITLFVTVAFGEYGAYRARCYRLTRTVFRGLRFHQTGSAIHFATRAVLWWIPVVLTLGLALPWRMSNLERYKMRNTFYGDLSASFAGSGTSLFLRSFPIWLVIIVPLAAGLAKAAVLIDWSLIADALRRRDLDELGKIIAAHPLLAAGSALAAVTVAGTALCGAVLYPAYDAIAMRWWLGGLRLGGAAVASDLRITRYYGAYLAYLACVILFTIAFALALGLAFGLTYGALRGHADFAGQAGSVALGLLSGFVDTILREYIELVTDAAPGQNAVAAAEIVIYLVYMLGLYTIYQVVLKRRLWRAAVESMQISGHAAFSHVRARESASSAIGEGLVDAFSGGGI